MTHTTPTVVWATDGSVEAEAALEAARALLPEHVAFVAVHVDQHIVGRGGGYSVLADEPDVRAALEARIAELRETGLEIELVVRTGHTSPADAIAAIAAEHDATCIVCGTRGLGVVGGALLGSVAQRLLHLAPCAVLTVPNRVAAARAADLETAEV